MQWVGIGDHWQPLRRRARRRACWRRRRWRRAAPPAPSSSSTTRSRAKPWTSCSATRGGCRLAVGSETVPPAPPPNPGTAALSWWRASARKPFRPQCPGQGTSQQGLPSTPQMALITSDCVPAALSTSMCWTRTFCRCRSWPTSGEHSLAATGAPAACCCSCTSCASCAACFFVHIVPIVRAAASCSWVLRLLWLLRLLQLLQHLTCFPLSPSSSSSSSSSFSASSASPV